MLNVSPRPVISSTESTTTSALANGSSAANMLLATICTDRPSRSRRWPHDLRHDPQRQQLEDRQLEPRAEVERLSRIGARNCSCQISVANTGLETSVRCAGGNARTLAWKAPLPV